MLQLNGFCPENSGIRHGFFGRQGGISTGAFASLNCGAGSGDDQESVLENRNRVAAQLGTVGDALITPYQTHSTMCTYLDHVPIEGDRPQGDALVTDKPGVFLGILTADCGPILFHGTTAQGAPVVGAAHAGWRGALGGILEATVAMMCDHGAQLSGIRAAVGPCIGVRSYEVSMGFETPFLDRDPDDDVFFKSAARADKLMFDLPGYIARRLAVCGVRYVALADVDTCTSPDYFSYRRSTLAGEKAYGRHISVIGF